MSSCICSRAAISAAACKLARTSCKMVSRQLPFPQLPTLPPLQAPAPAQAAATAPTSPSAAAAAPADEAQLTWEQREAPLA